MPILSFKKRTYLHIFSGWDARQAIYEPARPGHLLSPARAFRRVQGSFPARHACQMGLAGYLLTLLLFLTGPIPRVYADGGAPNLAYVAGASTGVGVIDIAQQRLARSFSTQGTPGMLLLSPDNGLLYIPQPEAGTVDFLAAKTGQLICQAAFPGHPARLALNVDSTVLYVASLSERTLLALNAQNCAQEASFQAPEPVQWLTATLVTTGAGATPQTQLWLAGEQAVSILNDQGQVLDRIAIAGGAAFLCLPGALTAYVATRQGEVLALDMLTHRIIGTLLSGGSFGAMDYNAVTGEIYVPDQRSKQIDVLTPVLTDMPLQPHEPAYTLPVNGVPQSIAITNDGQMGFVALSDGRVAMLDVPGRSTLKVIPVGGRPHFIITGAYPPPAVPAVIAPAHPLSPWLWAGPGLLIALLLATGGGPPLAAQTLQAGSDIQPAFSHQDRTAKAAMTTGQMSTGRTAIRPVVEVGRIADA